MDLSNESILHVKKPNLEYLQFKKLLEYGVLNCYTTRLHDFDLAFTVEKSKQEANYQRLCEGLGIERESIVRPFQTHTDHIQVIEKRGETYQDVDGLITNKVGINLMLTFADCTPILIYDPKHQAIGNIHSGWKGTLQRIGQKAIGKMQETYQSNPEDLWAFLGPCIQKCHFEVEEDVKELFATEFASWQKNQEFIQPLDNQKYFIDTTRINQLMLMQAGVLPEHIIDSGICTVCASDVLHSYRKDGDKSGRNVAVIGLK